MTSKVETERGQRNIFIVLQSNCLHWKLHTHGFSAAWMDANKSDGKQEFAVNEDREVSIKQTFTSYSHLHFLGIVPEFFQFSIGFRFQNL